jgi:hypothetical protein
MGAGAAVAATGALGLVAGAGAAVGASAIGGALALDAGVYSSVTCGLSDCQANAENGRERRQARRAKRKEAPCKEGFKGRICRARKEKEATLKAEKGALKEGEPVDDALKAEDDARVEALDYEAKKEAYYALKEEEALKEAMQARRQRH